MIVLRLSPVRAGLCSLRMPKTRSAGISQALTHYYIKTKQSRTY